MHYISKEFAESPYPVQVIITIPKKNFPKAAHRNRIKRLIREAYRKNKSELYDYLAQKNLKIVIAIIYASKNITTFNEAEIKIKLALKRLMQQYERVE